MQLFLALWLNNLNDKNLKIVQLKLLNVNREINGTNACFVLFVFISLVTMNH